MTNEEGKELLDVLMDAGSKVTNERFKTAVKKEAATVRFVNGNDVYIRPMSDVSTPTVANPTQLSDLDAGDVLLSNETWQSLSAGDLVEVVYAQSLNDGFIIRKIGVGDALICDTMDERQRRCYAKLSSAGWYRVFVYDADVASYVVGDLGFVVDVMLIEWARQIHEITLAGVLGSCGWINEFSYTNVNYFDKIRYMQNGTHGYIDVHYIGSNSNRDESCYFDVKTIKPEIRKQFYSVDFVSVLDAPAGETVVSMYTFLTNTSHPNITHGTGSPSGGHDGDVFIKHS